MTLDLNNLRILSVDMDTPPEIFAALEMIQNTGDGVIQHADLSRWLRTPATDAEAFTASTAGELFWSECETAAHYVSDLD